MLGSGNIGAHLDSANVNAYYSSDSGITWQEVAQGEHIPEIGDHGTIVTLLPTSETDQLLYTIYV